MPVENFARMEKFQQHGNTRGYKADDDFVLCGF
jgi:hypothetical protein